MAFEPIRLTRGVPAVESFPYDLLAQCAAAVFQRKEPAILQYGQSGGYMPLREWIAGQAGVDSNRVILGQGSLQLQDTLARLLIQPGDLVYVEEPTYDRTLTLLRRAGARPVGIPLTPQGLDLDALEARLTAGECPVLFYIIPDFQNPSGSELALPSRRRLVELARKFHFWIVEDSPYRQLRYRGSALPALFDLAPERVLQMSSFSKLIAPSLRVGYAIAPPELAPRLLKFSEDTYINPSFIDEAIVSEFIQRGWLAPNLEHLKSLYAPRLDAMLTALERKMTGLADWVRPDGGFFIGVELRRPVTTPELLARAKDAGLLLTDGRGFFAGQAAAQPGGRPDQFVRLPFCALQPEEIEAGVDRLAEVVASFA